MSNPSGMSGRPRKNTFIDEDASDQQSRKRWATAPDTMQLGGLGDLGNLGDPGWKLECVEDQSGGFLRSNPLGEVG